MRDQQVRYFESCGEVRQPRLMFQADLFNLIRIWKIAGDNIILLGDFNKNVYDGKFDQGGREKGPRGSSTKI